MEASALFVATELCQSLFPPTTQVGFSLEGIRQMVVTRKLQFSRELTSKILQMSLDMPQIRYSTSHLACGIGHAINVSGAPLSVVLKRSRSYCCSRAPRLLTRSLLCSTNLPDAAYTLMISSSGLGQESQHVQVNLLMLVLPQLHISFILRCCFSTSRIQLFKWPMLGFLGPNRSPTWTTDCSHPGDTHKQYV